ncbi:hypothetical protein PHMEG_00023031 [Phytophthora megakarya]|uniref:Reverse transcriptase/retrotransposon-derived protein RNase H-like domain-containing protein n=1 Tax=Phytophthora megakarya TaxID=4795 RepID=A0A225VJN1_9STRA|nr:hypothetical protein PHMEG_00023031 [Phytophthora megakarya]
MRSAEEDAECAKPGMTESPASVPSLKPTERPHPPWILVNSPTGDMFANVKSEESSFEPAFDRSSFVDDIGFGSESFDGRLATLGRRFQRFTEYRITVSFTKSIYVQSRVDFLSNKVVPKVLRADPKKSKRVTEFSFPTTKKGMQSFLGALNYYSSQNAVPTKGEDFESGGDLSTARQSFPKLQQKIGDAPILRHLNRVNYIHVTLEWVLSSTLMQEHDEKLHPVQFCGRVLKDAEMNYHPAEKEVLALLLLLKTCYTQLAARAINMYTRFSTLGWFAVLLSPWHLIVSRVKEKDCAFAQLLQAGLTSFVDLEDSLATVTPPTKGSPTVRLDPQLLYARLLKSHHGFVVSFDRSAMAVKYGGYGSCSWILWRLPEWTIMTATSAYLEATTVNMAEYSGMNCGLQAALDHGATEFIIVGDSRLEIQQSLGVIVCKKTH